MRSIKVAAIALALVFSLSVNGAGVAQVNLTQQGKLTADATRFGAFGQTVAIFGDTALVGAPFDDDGGNNSGAAYVFVRSGADWSQQARLTAQDVEAEDLFGRSVAISGDMALVGAPQEDGAGSSSGALYVFLRTGVAWSQLAKLTADDAVAGDRFGESVAFSGDTVLVGATGRDDRGTNSGAAYVFVRSGTSLVQRAKLTADDGAVLDQLGNSVAAAPDTALVGARAEGGFAGAAYVFVRSGTGWVQQSKLTADDASGRALFGHSVALIGDTALVGAPEDRDDAGAAYVFVRSGARWMQKAELTAENPRARNRFGASTVFFSADALLVGAPTDDNSNVGAAYVFLRSGTEWTRHARFTNDDFAPGAFGLSMAASGGTVVIGAPISDRNFGAAYVFAPADSDGDGVPDDLDVCPDTVIPEGVPTRRLGRNRFGLVGDDGVFDTNRPPGRGPGDSFTIEETGGCSCEQIIDTLGLGKGHVKFGCSIGAMKAWVGLVNP